MLKAEVELTLTSVHSRIGTCISVITFSISFVLQKIALVNMPKRKAVKEVKQGEVDLPSLPDNVLNGDTSAGEPARKTRKRKVEDEVQVDVDVTPKKRNKRVTEGKDEQVSDDDVKQKRTKKRKVEVKDEEQTDVYGKGEVVEKKVKKKRKTKEEKEAEAMPLAVRTVGHKLYIGAHVSSSGGQFCLRFNLSSYGSSTKHPDRRSQFRP